MLRRLVINRVVILLLVQGLPEDIFRVLGHLLDCCLLLYQVLHVVDHALHHIGLHDVVACLLLRLVQLLACRVLKERLVDSIVTDLLNLGT